MCWGGHSSDADSGATASGDEVGGAAVTAGGTDATDISSEVVAGVCGCDGGWEISVEVSPGDGLNAEEGSVGIFGGSVDLLPCWRRSSRGAGEQNQRDIWPAVERGVLNEVLSHSQYLLFRTSYSGPKKSSKVLPPRTE